MLAVADATVVRVRDGFAENVPGHGDAFHPAVPITMDTVGGNTIVLDLGGGQYVWYFQQPGSIREVGERVRRGESMARVGCSGDAREPHLHLEVTTSGDVLRGEGVPYVIDRFGVRTGDAWDARTRELPLDHLVVDFGTEGEGSDIRAH